MKANTITTIILEADEGCLLVNKLDNTLYGKKVYCPVQDVGNYEEYPEAEAMELVRIAEEEKARQEAEELARLEQEEREASEHGDNSSTNN